MASPWKTHIAGWKMPKIRLYVNGQTPKIVLCAKRWMPSRNADRQPRAKGALLASLVPFERVLYLFRLKDEGIMFYYGRPVRRLSSAGELPASAEPVYCILTETEWQEWSPDGRELLFLRTNRRQNVMELAAANLSSGACRVR